MRNKKENKLRWTQEEKELLLKDICARLPYGIILDVDTTDWRAPQGHIKVKIEGLGILFKDMSLIINGSYYGDKYKPYLRPLSSMTEEEKIELYQIAGFYYLSNNELLKDEWRQFSGALSENKLFLPYPIWEDNLNKVYNWLNAHHFDYRGLIERDLAITVTEENNPYEN